MNLLFTYQGIARSIDSILEFTKPGTSAFWSSPIFHFFPELDKDKYTTMDEEERREYLVSYFEKFERENAVVLQEKVNKYNARWEECCSQIVSALEVAFECDLTEVFQDMRGYITFNCISPRYLENSSFDVFYLNSENGAIGLAIHEIIHFVWFYVWSKHFKDSAEEYETPHLKWILSEMVVDSFMRDERLAGINPYHAHGGSAYPYFYTLQVDGENILETLHEMRQKMSICEFMEESYNFCLKHEAEIREHIERSEFGECDGN